MESGGTISLNMAAWDDWDRGFGRIDKKIETYKDNLLRLRGIVFEFGGFERDWMLDGGEYFTTRLSLAGVAVELVVQEGEHGEVDDEGRVEDEVNKGTNGTRDCRRGKTGETGGGIKAENVGRKQNG